MIFTTAQIVRNGSPVPGLTNLQNVQIDEVQADPRMFDGGAAPFDVYSIFIPYVPTATSGSVTYVPRVFGGTLVLGGVSVPIAIQRNDQVQDMGASNTGLYRIFSKPETFVDGHVEILGFQKVGS